MPISQTHHLPPLNVPARAMGMVFPSTTCASNVHAGVTAGPSSQPVSQCIHSTSRDSKALSQDLLVPRRLTDFNLRPLPYTLRPKFLPPTSSSSATRRTDRYITCRLCFTLHRPARCSIAHRVRNSRGCAISHSENLYSNRRPATCLTSLRMFGLTVTSSTQ
jgi:hypothetical protein